MQSRGVYYGLVEQQHLNQTVDEENIIVENHKLTNTLLPDQDNSEIRKRRRSSIISFTSSVLSASYTRKNSNVTKEPDNKAEKEITTSITRKILQTNKPEWLFIVIGCIAAFFNGALEPTSAVVQTKLVTVKDLSS
jgi:hypothetical protein